MLDYCLQQWANWIKRVLRFSFFTIICSTCTALRLLLWLIQSLFILFHFDLKLYFDLMQFFINKRRCGSTRLLLNIIFKFYVLFYEVYFILLRWEQRKLECSSRCWNSSWWNGSTGFCYWGVLGLEKKKKWK